MFQQQSTKIAGLKHPKHHAEHTENNALDACTTYVHVWGFLAVARQQWHRDRFPTYYEHTFPKV